jgi:hypothetical protein
MTCGAILARNAEHASLLHRHQLASHDGILWGGFSYLKTNLGASARETERVERPARGGNLRTLELRRVLLLLAGHVGSRSRFPAGEFLDKMSGKAGESRHHGQHGPLEARPAAGFAPALRLALLPPSVAGRGTPDVPGAARKLKRIVL